MKTAAQPPVLAVPASPRTRGPTPAAWRGGLLYAVAAVAAAAAVFAYRQNAAGQLGGPISLEKTLWLNYAITAWFVLPVFLARHPEVTPPLRRILGIFLASMTVRGVVELWLLYVTVSWDPFYGIAHDLSAIVLIDVLRRRYRPRLQVAADDLNHAVRGFLWTLQGSLGVEIVFALLFRETGAHLGAVYFAAATADYAHINQLTRVVDIVVYADLTRLFWSQRRRLFFHPPAVEDP